MEVGGDPRLLLLQLEDRLGEVLGAVAGHRVQQLQKVVPADGTPCPPGHVPDTRIHFNPQPPGFLFPELKPTRPPSNHPPLPVTLLPFITIETGAPVGGSSVHGDPGQSFWGTEVAESRKRRFPGVHYQSGFCVSGTVFAAFRRHPPQAEWRLSPCRPAYQLRRVGSQWR